MLKWAGNNIINCSTVSSAEIEAVTIAIDLTSISGTETKICRDHEQAERIHFVRTRKS